MTLADPAGNLKGFVLGLRLGPGLGNGSGGQIVLRSSNSTNRKLPPNTALLKIRGGELLPWSASSASSSAIPGPLFKFETGREQVGLYNDPVLLSLVLTCPGHRHEGQGLLVRHDASGCHQGQGVYCLLFPRCFCLLLLLLLLYYYYYYY